MRENLTAKLPAIRHKNQQKHAFILEPHKIHLHRTDMTEQGRRCSSDPVNMYSARVAVSSAAALSSKISIAFYWCPHLPPQLVEATASPGKGSKGSHTARNPANLHKCYSFNS